MSNDVTPSAVTRHKSAKRTKAYRARRREGLRCVLIRVKPETVETLEENGYLEGGRDRQKVADAVELFISDHMPRNPRE
jgi:hypothetical protein